MTGDDLFARMIGGSEYINKDQNNREAARDMYALLMAFMAEGFTREEAFELLLTIVAQE